MKTLVHISDIHFGKTDDKCIFALLETFKKIKPDLIVISGDLTQRAKVSEFKKAVKLLGEFKEAGFSYFVVPGNHDLEPLYKITRVFSPFRQYKKHISSTLEPTYVDDEIAIASILTARARNIKDGHINMRQVKRVQSWFKKQNKDLIKILVTHHPLDLPITRPKRKLAKRSQKGIRRFSHDKVDLYLSGHFHRSSCVHTSDRYKIDGYSAVAVQAGTLSVRHRGEVQSFNTLTINKQTIAIDTYLWHGKEGYKKAKTNQFTCSSEHWKIELQDIA